MLYNPFFLGLITRCKDEFFIKKFCNYYISQGVDKIYIIDDNSNDKTIYNNINSNKVSIIYKKNIIKTNYANTLYKQLRNNFIWMIYVDVDEFITTKKYKKNTIRYELSNTFRNCDCIKIPWVMMSCNKRKKNPKSVLKQNIYRWNHDLKHPYKSKSNANLLTKFRCRYKSIETKCIFKCSKFGGITDHAPTNKTINKPIIVDSIENKKQKLGVRHNHLRENDINTGYLLCYHYRIISYENSENKLRNNKWYIDNGYTLNDLMRTDYSEIIDNTLKIKS